jgi:hypothetical protein
MPEPRRTESDVQATPEQADSREPDGAYVGRVAPDDATDIGETGAERRSQEQRG